MANMEIKRVKALADILNEKCLSSLELEEGDVRIKLERGNKAVDFSNGQNTIAVPVEESKKEDSLTETREQEVNFNNLKEIKSPMVGVYYSSPSPDSKPFVKVGDKVKKGDLLCIVEAMKLMNDITSDADGEVIDICVNNGDVVEFSQTLFKLV